MIIEQFINFCKISRLDAALSVFGCIYLLYFNYSGDVDSCFRVAAPAIPSIMCTFILNNYNDCEDDSINHPDRPLASGATPLHFAIGFYFLCVLFSLALIFRISDHRLMFTHFAFLVLAINYNYIKTQFPIIKSLYVALCYLVLTFLMPAPMFDRLNYAFPVISIFLFCLGRELLMDILDMRGDGRTLPNVIGEEKTMRIAFILQLLGVSVLIPDVSSLISLLFVFGNLILILGCVQIWNKEGGALAATQLSRINIFVACVFLF